MNAADDAERTPDPIDIHIGQRIRARRKALGVSQERLAAALGLTFQQVQKYERGANRVSGSKLWHIAESLQTAVSAFYEGLMIDGALAVQEAPAHFEHDSPEIAELRELLKGLDERHRQIVLDLARSLAGEASPQGRSRR
ncbi:MAG: helix-turn-helix transcriptional regulator [Caulobacteraceae bacterium]|nr:helix-turn-helix transcriptional regulator [Caulobacter sp.]